MYIKKSHSFLLWKKKSKTECPFWMYWIFVNIKNLPLLPTTGQLSVEFIHILGALFFCLHISLVLSTHSFVHAFKLDWLTFSKTNFLNGYPEKFINKCFQRVMDSIHVDKETTVAVEKKSFVKVLPFFSLPNLSFL